MRNLKKVLSLALAMVMLLGMMVIGAGAVDATEYPDYGDVSADKQEAVQVITKLSVIDGTEKGMEPQSTLTRAQAATIVARALLGRTVADALASSTCVFTDVPDWAKGAVQYCADRGIVFGIGNNLFGSNNPVKGTEFATMLLRAVDPEGDYSGSGWENKAIVAANKFGLSDKVAVTSTALTREGAAQMAFNTITSYSPSGATAWSVDGKTFDSFIEAYLYADKLGKVSEINKTAANDSLAATVFNLTSSNKTDAFGRSTKVWTYDDEDIVTIPGTAADKTYTAEKSNLSSDLKDYTFASDAKLFENGRESNITSSNAATFVAGKTKNGTEVLVYASNKVISKVVVVNEYVDDVDVVTAAKGDDKRTVTVNGKKFETEDFEKGDVVLFTQAYNSDTGKYDIKTMALANVVENVEVTKTVGTNGATSFTADGTEYKYAEICTTDKTAIVTQNKVDLYLDSYDYVVMVKLNEGVSSMGYVLDIGRDGTRYDADNTFYAKLLLTDGTVVEGKLNKADYDSTKNLPESNPTQVAALKTAFETAFKNHIVKFTVNSKDVYKLTDESGEANEIISNGSASITITNGQAKMTLGALPPVYADSKTIFMVDNGNNSYSIYTGYDEVPNMTGTSASYSVARDGNVATVVYLKNVVTSSKDVMFLLGSKCAANATTVSGVGSYYECPAVVNGEIVTAKLSTKISSDRLLNSIVYSDEENEIISSVTTSYPAADSNVSYYVTGNLTKVLTNGNIGIDSTDYRVSDDVQVFLCGDNISESSINSVTVNDDVIFAVVTEGKVVTVFYKEDGTVGGGDTNTYSVSVTGSTANMTYTITDGTTTKNNEALTGIASGANVTVNFTANAGYKFEDGTTYAKFVYTGINEDKTVSAPVVVKGVADVNLKFDLDDTIRSVTIGGTPYTKTGMLTGKKGTLLKATVQQVNNGAAPLTVVFRPDDMSGDVEIDYDVDGYYVTLDRDGTLVVTTDSQKIAFDNAKKFVESRVFDVWYLVDGTVGKMQYYDNADYAWNNNAWSVPVTVTNWAWPEGSGDGKIHIQADEATLKSALKSMMGEDLRSDKNGKDIRIESWGDVTVLRPDGVNDLRFTQTVTVNKYNNGTKGDEIGTITVTYKVHNASGTWDTDHFTETK